MSEQRGDINRHAPVRGIIRWILEQSKEPVSCAELTTRVFELWQRSFPDNPYFEQCLIYKLTASFDDVKVESDDPEDALMQPEGEGDPVWIHPSLGPDDLNRGLNQIMDLRFSLKR